MWAYAVRSAPSSTFTHCELDGTAIPPDAAIPDQGDDGTFAFCNVHGGIRGLAFGSKLIAIDSWFHAFKSSTIGTHREAILSNGVAPGGYALLQRDWFQSGSWTDLSGEIGLFGDFGSVHDITVTGSVLIDSGSYQFYGGSCSSKNFPVAQNIVVMANAFGPTHVKHPPGSQYGYASCWAAGNGDVWYDNVVLGTRARVRPS